MLLLLFITQIVTKEEESTKSKPENGSKVSNTVIIVMVKNRLSKIDK